MGINIAISLEPHYEEFINTSVQSGKYSSASEVVRSALSLLESKENKLSELRNSLIEGENSPMLDNYNTNKHLEELHSKYLWLQNIE